MTDQHIAVTTAESVRDLIACYDELDGELLRVDAGARRAAVEAGAPLNLDVLDAKRMIDQFAFIYVKMLVDDTGLIPAADDTPTHLEAIASRIGHFTHDVEHPDIADDFLRALRVVSEHCWAIARPNGVAMVPINHGCVVDGCKGILRVRIDRDRPLDEESLTLWRPMAVCTEDREHAVDAKILMHSADTA